MLAKALRGCQVLGILHVKEAVFLLVVVNQEKQVALCEINHHVNQGNEVISATQRHLLHRVMAAEEIVA